MPSSQDLRNFGKINVINVNIFESANEDGLKNNILK